jgi:hypothetical protein
LIQKREHSAVGDVPRLGGSRRKPNMNLRSLKTRHIRTGALVIALSVSSLMFTACGTLTGAAVGAGAGAAIGAGTGYGAGKGALIGTGVGAGAGAIYDITR